MQQEKRPKTPQQQKPDQEPGRRRDLDEFPKHREASDFGTHGGNRSGQQAPSESEAEAPPIDMPGE